MKWLDWLILISAFILTELCLYAAFSFLNSSSDISQWGPSSVRLYIFLIFLSTYGYCEVYKALRQIGK